MCFVSSAQKKYKTMYHKVSSIQQSTTTSKNLIKLRNSLDYGHKSESQ